jgi:excinuclease ABC subunit A
MRNLLHGTRDAHGSLKGISGHEHLDKVVIIDQMPIGKTPRSNPATYTGVFTDVRDVFSQTLEARARGYGPGHFSFNTKQGRCDACE